VAELRAFADSRPGAASFQSMGTASSHVTAASWPVLRCFSGLTHLESRGLWQLDKDSWAQLPRAFPQLRSLSVRTSWEDEPESDCAAWLPAVAQCVQLTELRVWHHILPPASLQQLLEVLPLLRTLTLSSCVLESVAPLASTRALTSLRIEHCRQRPRCRDGTVLEPRTDWRLHLPSLSQLRKLELPGVLGRSETGDQAESEARRAALLGRMPMLAAVNYTEPTVISWQ